MTGLLDRRNWMDFSYRSTNYSLSHLDAYEFTIRASDKNDRRILVLFSDHCFTRSPESGDDDSLMYPGSSRNPGVFCFDRYVLSLHIRDHISQMVEGSVWIAESDTNFMFIPIVQHDGKLVYYGIIFSLNRVKGLNAELAMRVRTAFPYTEDRPVTHGRIRFKHLVTLRMTNKLPGRIVGQTNKWPEL